MNRTKFHNDQMLGANKTDFANPFFEVRQVQKVISLVDDADVGNESQEVEVRKD
jgi:hypothetical protein